MRLAQWMAGVLVSVLAFASVGFAQHRDHPLLSRYTGSTEVESDYFVHEFDEYPLVTGPYASKKFSKVQRLEGKVSRYHYKDPANRSTLEIARTYQQQLERAGFQILFACSGKECGDANHYEMDKWLGEWCAIESGVSNCASEPMRYVAAKLARPTGDVYVAVKIEHPLYDGARSGTYLAIVETKPIDTGNVRVNAAALASDISTTGHAAIYGIYFDTGKSEVKPESDTTLEEIAKLLASNPQLKLLVVGHTDNVGTLAANMALSKQRADAVVTALTARYRVAAARLQSGGAGPLAPVATNHTDDGRAKNRRVELVEQ